MRFADLILLSWGWRRRAIAFFAGAVGALALAPISFFPALFITMTVAVWLIDGSVQTSKLSHLHGISFTKSARAAAIDGWFLGFGYFLAGLWWLGSAFLVEADKFAWAIPFAVGGLPAVLACFTGLGFAVARLVWSTGAGRIFALAFGLGVTEWARGYVATGFPWNAFGMALGSHPWLAQPAAWVGLYGLTILSIIIFASPACLADRTATGQRATRMAMFGFVLLGLVAAGSSLRLWQANTDTVPGVKLRLMQPNLPQDAKFRAENKEAILRHYLTLSDRATSPETSGVGDVTHLIWPESAFPFLLHRDAGTLAKLGAFLTPSTLLITGAARAEEPLRAQRLMGEMDLNYFNSVQVLDASGEIIATYDKAHLVPFGEYVPFAGLLEQFGVRHLVHIPGGFEAADHRQLLDIPGLPLASALVCYEAIFPGDAVPAHAQRPGLLLNVTNDGWFGATFGPYQHFSQARLRAIEEGLPLVRVANTGISAVIDGYGRVWRELPLNVEGVIDSALPRALPPTLFSNHSVFGPFLLLLLSLALALTLARRS
jgi:apolipoprotein N-acyltransferase